MAKGARLRTPTWYIVLILVACFGADAATPQLPGAFDFAPGASSDVIHAPGQSVVTASTSIAGLRGPGRASAVRTEAVRVVTSPHPRPIHFRAAPRVSRAPETKTSDTPDDD